MAWNEEHRCRHDGDLHPTFCSECDCRHYQWNCGLTSTCTCGHSCVSSHNWRPNCDGTFEPEVEARLAAERAEQ